MLRVSFNESIELSSHPIQVIAPAPGREASVAYFTIHNRGSNAVVLNGVTSPQFGRVEMHETVLEMGIARMRLLNSLKVDARSSVELAAGGKHLMLSEPVKVLLLDNPVSLHLQFASTGRAPGLRSRVKNALKLS